MSALLFEANILKQRLDELQQQRFAIDKMIEDTETELVSTGFILEMDPTWKRELMRMYGVSDEEMMSRNRYRNVVEARSLTMYILKLLFPQLTLSDIGRHFKKDHATVIHATKAVDQWLRFDKNFRAQVRKFADCCSNRKVKEILNQHIPV